MPRAPAVFPKKEKWRLQLDEEALSEECKVNDNYKSALLSPDRMRSEFQEQVDAGMMVKMDYHVARKKYGDSLSIAPLALIEEREGAFRIVRDATHKVLVNHRIHVRDQEEMPGPEDVKGALQALWADSSSPVLTLVFDVSKARRRICIREEDWGHQACAVEARPQDPEAPWQIYLNTVGTYGGWVSQLLVGQAGQFHHQAPVLRLGIRPILGFQIC